MNSMTCASIRRAALALSVKTAPKAPEAKSIALRSFSSDCVPAQRIRSVLEEYRQEHFSRELPSRFKKEVIKALTMEEGSGSVVVDNLNLILNNIGRQDACLTAEEMTVLLHEVGSTDRRVSVDKIMQLM